MNKMICIGHRGASGYSPENTLKSFAMAIEMGCTWIELDVYAVEGELIVIHDDDLKRTTNGRGKVMETSLAKLRELDAGEGQQIPLLREVIEMVDHRAVINIELKGPETAMAVNSLLSTYCQQGWRAEEFFISSFDHEELALTDAQFRRGALFGSKVNQAQQRSLNLHAWSANLSLRSVTPALVDQLHAADLKVLVYTVNKPQDIQLMMSMGVDGIFSDVPDVVFTELAGVE